MRIYTRGELQAVEFVIDDDGNLHEPGDSEFEEFPVSQLVQCKHCDRYYDPDFDESKAPHFDKEDEEDSLPICSNGGEEDVRS